MENVPHKGLDFLGKFNLPNLVPCILGDDFGCIVFIPFLLGQNMYQLVDLFHLVLSRVRERPHHGVL